VFQEEFMVSKQSAGKSASPSDVVAVTVSPEHQGLKLGELLDRKQVAVLLGISVATLKAWVCERKGPVFYKMGSGRGSRVFYRREDVQGWLDSNAVRIQMKG
jgi:predicted DNA-binding transcriptional regulator AlpA